MSYRLFTSSLKSRLYTLMIICSTIPIILIGSLSMYSISSILDNKIDKGLMNHLDQVRGNLITMLNNLEYSSQQFTINGLIGSDLANWLEIEDLHDSLTLSSDIQKKINLFNFTNPTVGLTMYYNRDSESVVMSNQLVKEFKLNDLTKLTNISGASYYGPHYSNYKYSNTNMVISIIRKFDIGLHTPQTSNIEIYVETNFKVFEKILNSAQYGMGAFHVLVDKQGYVAYSQNNDLLPIGSLYDSEGLEQYVAFEDMDQKDLRLVVFVDRSDYNSEFNKWIGSFIIVIILSITASILIAITIRNYVYRPLINIKKGMYLVSANNFNTRLEHSGLLEFDYLIDQFNNMGFKIQELIKQLEVEEKMKRETEVAKLMAQINPHFLYNTLNTVQWLARMNGQKEIDQFIVSFTKVLSYNLGKDGIIVTVNQELEALKDYIALQQVRYDHQYDIRLHVDEAMLDVEVPRFLMQPLVENSLYHGLGDVGGMIEVIIEQKNHDRLNIIVRDNGAGIDQQKIDQLLSDGVNKTGFGIGLNYVYKTVKSNYGAQGELIITSKKGEGTSIQVTLPLNKEGTHHD
ncbi:MAG: histidine kinase [Candidatus Pristimantibacillus lignocellulolyticus]|uniref:histidine kinase n=1 Tax=Candidatus Pristimantibacillus lignocellulolyticus TaxID=2994561 RepID=A0A9J6ZHZ1_9BACL|nr:MAG: histidine kinase [Candidatus Pristimantibacillus lignocellulolyticus]